jgi:hypothetical protein
MIGPILFVLTCIGALCLVRGLMGRRVGHRPRCARCRYDLSGVEMEVEHCPECGSAVGPASSVVVGYWRPIWPLTIAGAIVTAFGVSSAALNIWATATGFEWIRTRSFGALVSDLESGATLSRDVSDEIMRRLAAGELTPPQTDRFVRALASRPSNSASSIHRITAVTPLLSDQEHVDLLHGALLDQYLALDRRRRAEAEGALLRRVIESEFAAGRLQARAEDYFRTTIDIRIEAGPVVSGAEAPIRYAVAFRSLPTASSTPRGVTVALESGTPGFEVVFDGPAEVRWDLEWYVNRSRAREPAWTTGRVSTELPPGRYAVDFDARVTLRDVDTNRRIDLTIPVSRAINVLPRSTETRPPLR